jgi:hypothetical protein
MQYLSYTKLFGHMTVIRWQLHLNYTKTARNLSSGNMLHFII